MKDLLHGRTQPAAGGTIHGLFAEQVSMEPDACALVQGARRMSYRELDEASDQVARFLLHHAITSEECVVVHAGRTIEMVVASLGVLKAGGCYVPLDPALPAGRKRFMLHDSGARTMLVESTFDPGPQSWGAGARRYLIDDILSSAGVRATQFPRCGSRRLAYVMYTSGSTGKPKGVLIEHRGVACLVKDNHYVPLQRHARIVLAGALGFDATTFEIWGSLLNGLSLHLADLATLNAAHSLKHALQQWGITTMFATTSFCARRVQEDPAVFRSLQYLLIGGEVLKPALSNAIRRVSPGLRVINVYGPTESTTFATSFEVEAEYSSSIPIGKPIRGTTAFIVDEDLVPLQDGSAGEIVLAGEGLARGYLNRPELTRERFVEVAGLGRVYRTGDLGYRQADGNMQFIGRKDRQVKIGGYRVEPGEIEHALCAIEAVQDCTVKLVDRNEEQFLAAYYVPARQGVEPAELRQRLITMLPDHLLPTFLIALDLLPLDAHGKIDRHALPDPFAAGAGRQVLSSAVCPDAGESPATLAGVQTRVKHVWEKVLAVRDPDIDADFYDLGGTSIKAIHMLGCLSAQGFDVSLSDILHHLTIGKLAAFLASTLQRGKLIESWPEAMAFLRERFPGAEFARRVYSVVQDGRTQEISVLYHRNLPVAEQKLLDILASNLSAELSPHYIRTADGQEGAAPGHVSGKQLCELLGLRAAQVLCLDELKAQVMRDYGRNDRAIQGCGVLEECRFSPTQELQFSFRTPMSTGHFMLDRPVNLALLERAVRRLIEEQDLLASIPLEKAQRRYWRKFDVRAAGPLGPSVIDLSSCYCDDEEVAALVRELIGALDFWGQHLLYHLLVIKRNVRQHSIVLVFNHVLFDRVSEEVIRRRVLTNYEQLFQRRLSPAGEEQVRSAPERPSFFAYVRQVRRGPVDISPSSLVQYYALQEFQAQKHRLLTACGLEPVDHSSSFQIAVPRSGHLEGGCSLGLALALYVKALGSVFGMDAMPLLFIYDGRKYCGTGYYDIIGECIDYVPMLLQTHLDPPELQQVVNARLAALSSHNVNFLNLVNSPELSEQWRGIRQLIDPGAGYANIDLCMFNYLGNRPGRESCLQHYDPGVRARPNPLPLHSLLNCIAASYFDGLIFNFRTSYACDVEALRNAFCAAVL